MEIENLLIIPDGREEKQIDFARENGLGFEYNDFITPGVLSDDSKIKQCIKEYKEGWLPQYNTMHGAFLDVLIFSEDPQITQIGEKRIWQSLMVAKRMGVKGVVFHTNHIPCFKDERYMENWIEKNEMYFKKCLREFEDMEIYMENMFDADPFLLEQLALRMKNEERFGICLDFAHACIFGKEIPFEIWAQHLGKYVKHVHINDSMGEKDEHLALGKGKLDFSLFKNCYEQFFPTASILLEVKGFSNQKESLDYFRSL